MQSPQVYESCMFLLGLLDGILIYMAGGMLPLPRLNTLGYALLWVAIAVLCMGGTALASHGWLSESSCLVDLAVVHLWLGAGALCLDTLYEYKEAKGNSEEGGDDE